MLDPGVTEELRKVEAKRRQLQKSLDTLQRDIVKTLEGTLDKDKWRILTDKSTGRAFGTPDTVNAKQAKHISRFY